MPLLTTLQNIMKLPNEIDEYLASRNFSENTRSNYHYDLVSLQAFFEDKSLTTENLELYKIQISNLSPAAQRRKISSANQYLLFLYQRQKVDQYFKIKQVVQKKSQTAQSYHPMIKEFPEFYVPLTCPGQFLALLINFFLRLLNLNRFGLFFLITPAAAETVIVIVVIGADIGTKHTFVPIVFAIFL